MGKLYDRADIYDLIDSDARTEIIKNDWKEFLGDADIHTYRYGITIWMVQ